MTWQLFSLILLVYYVYRVASAFLGFKRFPAIRAAIEIALVLIGLVGLAVGSPGIIIVSAGIGIAYLPITVSLTSPSLAYVLGFRYKFAEWIFAVVKDRASYLPVLLQTLKEELVWRSAFVYLGRFNNIPDHLLLVVGSILFYLIHWNPKGRIVILTEFELLCFSFLLYVVYLELHTLIGVWAIHFIRNSYLRYHRSMPKGTGA